MLNQFKGSVRNSESNKQTLPLKIAQNYTVQWAEFLGYCGSTYMPIGIYAQEKNTQPYKKVS